MALPTIQPDGGQRIEGSSTKSWRNQKRRHGRGHQERGRERLALRMEPVERVFGRIKLGPGSWQFPLRALATVNREWLHICLRHNLPELPRYVADAPVAYRQTCLPKGAGNWTGL